MKSRGRHTARVTALFAGMLLLAQPLYADSLSPDEWLDRMSAAVKTTSYEGTVVRVSGGAAEALKVVRVVADGVVRERIIAQEGNGLEIIRNGNEVHCIMPERKSVRVEEWNDQSTLFSSLPSGNLRFGSEYDVSIVRQERVAGRKAMLLAIRPHDQYRYGHKIWLDIETGFPLQTKLIDEEGDAIEQVKFAEISLDADVAPEALAPSYRIDTFTWVEESRHAVTLTVTSDWQATELPTGFKAVSTHAEEMSGSEDLVTHILYSDGVASVSVFIASAGGSKIKGKSRLGSSNSYSVSTGDHVVTAVGEVPAVTVERIASSMRKR